VKLCQKKKNNLTVVFLMNEQTCLQACIALMKRYHKCDLVAYVLVLKLNYEKSYDRISWDFLFEIISSSGLDKFGLIGLK